ncbi:hypothetical protein KR032_009640 [Drosophila birchii]|nr:hypothetical protein KR032_009640 [Drosophila birchii]
MSGKLFNATICFSNPKILRLVEEAARPLFNTWQKGPHYKFRKNVLYSMNLPQRFSTFRSFASSSKDGNLDEPPDADMDVENRVGKGIRFPVGSRSENPQIGKVEITNIDELEPFKEDSSLTSASSVDPLTPKASDKSSKDGMDELEIGNKEKSEPSETIVKAIGSSDLGEDKYKMSTDIFCQKSNPPEESKASGDKSSGGKPPGDKSLGAKPPTLPPYKPPPRPGPPSRSAGVTNLPPSGPTPPAGPKAPSKSAGVPNKPSSPAPTGIPTNKTPAKQPPAPPTKPTTAAPPSNPLTAGKAPPKGPSSGQSPAGKTPPTKGPSPGLPPAGKTPPPKGPSPGLPPAGKTPPPKGPSPGQPPAGKTPPPKGSPPGNPPTGKTPPPKGPSPGQPPAGKTPPPKGPSPGQPPTGKTPPPKGPSPGQPPAGKTPPPKGSPPGNPPPGNTPPGQGPPGKGGAEGGSRVITLMPGDGIGPEISLAVIKILEAVGAPLIFEPVDVTPVINKDGQTTVPEEVITSMNRTKVGLKGPLMTPVGTGFRSLNLTLRQLFNLYANVRPCRALPGAETVYGDVDIVTIRENTEGEYSGIEHTLVNGVVQSIKLITRQASLRVAEYAFQYALSMKRKKVTVVAEKNVMRMSDGLFLRCVQEMAAKYKSKLDQAGIEYEEINMTTLCLKLVIDPKRYDMLVLPNLYGDIISDTCAGLIGGLGLTPSGNVGEHGAIFESVHGTAPDIAGKDIANPTALLLSSVMMLHYIGMHEHADKIEQAVLKTISVDNIRTVDLGGKAKCSEYTDAVIKNLN